MKSYQHLLEQELIGKGFVYPSKYDGVIKGTIKSVVPIHDYYNLPGQGLKYQKLIINIISTSGIPYCLDEIYVDYNSKTDLK
jgi:hypothetical protein